MDQQPTDRELLREFSEQGMESAFQRLVQRHVDLVFATAYRRLGDRAAAQDVTQDVFIRLQRKAAWLRREVSLAGWLHKTTLLESQQWWRGELRRQRREQTAAELNTTMKDENPLVKSMAGVLDEGLMELGTADRQALILHYFEDRTYREIGAMVGAGEDTVRKRSDKALGNLTDFFRRCGYALPAGAAAAAAFRAAAEAAPHGLASMAARAALSSGSAASLGGTGLLFAKFMGLSYTQTAAVCVPPVPPRTSAGPVSLVCHRDMCAFGKSTLNLLES
jgi:RNA polymerase sigma factor (sigma-70 family)